MCQMKFEALRFYVDTRRLNDLPKQDLYSRAHIGKCNELLSEATELSMGGGNKGYCQLQIDEKESLKADFISQHRLYKLFVCRSGCETFLAHFDTECILYCLRYKLAVYHSIPGPHPFLLHFTATEHRHCTQ